MNTVITFIIPFVLLFVTMKTGHASDDLDCQDMAPRICQTWFEAGFCSQSSEGFRVASIKCKKTCELCGKSAKSSSVKNDEN